jgi:membrane AbrB-like protein
MTPPFDPRSFGPPRKYSTAAQWGFLLGASVPLAFLFELMGLPAALLLGPMVAGIILASNGGTVRTPALPVIAAQTFVGCLVARAITGEIVVAFIKGWPLFLGTVLAMIAACAVLGWLLTRYKVLPGTTAVWGTAPGGASVMMLMSGAFGADVQLVAFMQYLRVVGVAAVSSIVARLWVGASAPVAHATSWFPALPWLDFAGTLAVAGLGGAIGVRLRVPAGALLVPMAAGALLEGMGLLTIVLPPWLLAISYALLGWNVGLGFTRAILMHALRALPVILLSISVLIGVSGVLAFILVEAAGIDPLTAYLATCPGGVDSIAIIAASSNADMSFVMALQTARLLLVLILGPALARLIARRLM